MKDRELDTLHGSKGQEFPMVCTLATGVPANDEVTMQDEARLLYVAVTRATQELNHDAS